MERAGNCTEPPSSRTRLRATEQTPKTAPGGRQQPAPLRSINVDAKPISLSGPISQVPSSSCASAGADRAPERGRKASRRTRSRPFSDSLPAPPRTVQRVTSSCRTPEQKAPAFRTCPRDEIGPGDRRGRYGWWSSVAVAGGASVRRTAQRPELRSEKKIVPLCGWAPQTWGAFGRKPSGSSGRKRAISRPWR